ncbi:hypothetical protein Isop_1418 [Isosphaera pallida ATCC 43644]|uniref:DUF2357 domain-containing protein n=1 Tax=Isosphaera pallida (strain ATCC 43644 / DSM 9630 / IS1B) TaxID=575540 RepID=E8QY13_ISOPI|nr:DUF2357 domain-containing protein [Isosphaera pallida]ADV62003.1 hypothetical protein Isop_1418 [Isosphaera pallida ATCC 43644]
MISSNFYELKVKGPGDKIQFHERHSPAASTEPTRRGLSLHAAHHFAVSVARWGPNHPRLRLKLGEEILAEVPPGMARFETDQQPWLRNEFGESRILLEEVDEDGSARPLMIVDLQIIPRPEVVRDFRVMVEDLTEIHEGLALDVVGRGYTRKLFDGTVISRLQPRMVLDKLTDLYDHLRRALDLIAKQPSLTLHWNHRLARYRGGDRVAANAAARAARDPATRLDPQGRVVNLGKVLVRNAVLSDDLPEHRHIAEGLRRLESRSRGLAEHCRTSAQLLRKEQSRWGGQRTSGGPSVFEQRDLPRIEALLEQAREAEELAERFGDLLRTHDFLRHAGPPRTVLAPTPTFLGRTAYREVYRCLIQSRDPLGLLVDGDAFRISYRDLPTLYEYWCFLKTVAHLRNRFDLAGARSSFSLVDEIYRPELKPGQEFRFDAAPGVGLVVTYMPEFLEHRRADRAGHTYGAAFTKDPLRPDITVEVVFNDPNRPPVMLVLDAKSTDQFSPAKFRDLADYSRQIFDLRTGWQPIRQVVLLHRDRSFRPLANIPDYFEGRKLPPETILLGAVACSPERPGEVPANLALAIDLFLENQAGLPRPRAASSSVERPSPAHLDAF